MRKILGLLDSLFSYILKGRSLTRENIIQRTIIRTVWCYVGAAAFFVLRVDQVLLAYRENAFIPRGFFLHTPILSFILLCLVLDIIKLASRGTAKRKEE